MIKIIDYAYHKVNSNAKSSIPCLCSVKLKADKGYLKYSSGLRLESLFYVSHIINACGDISKQVLLRKFSQLIKEACKKLFSRSSPFSRF